jgi:hypothetical protein
MGLPLSIVWGHTVEEWVNVAPNDFPGSIGDELECDMSRRQISVPRRLL